MGNVGRKSALSAAWIACALFLGPSQSAGALVASPLAPPGAAMTVANGLIGYWPMDLNDTAGAKFLDRSGRGNHGTGNNLSAASLVKGQAGQALNVAGGASAYVQIAASPSLNVTPAYSFAAWFYATANSAAGGFFNHTVSAASASMNIEIYTQSGNRNILVAHNRSTTLSFASTSVNVYALNVWTHLCVSSGGGTTSVYINGALASGGTLAITQPVSQPSYVGIIGLESTIATGFQGKIDDARLYNRALSQPECKAIYLAGLGGSR